MISKIIPASNNAQVGPIYYYIIFSSELVHSFLVYWNEIQADDLRKVKFFFKVLPRSKIRWIT